MRHLNRKQKNILRRHGRNLIEQDLKPAHFDCYNYSHMTEKLHEMIEAMNCYENLDSDIDRFMNDIKTVADCKVI